MNTKFKFHALPPNQLNGMLKSLISSFDYQNGDSCCPHHTFKTSQSFVQASTGKIDKLSEIFEDTFPDINNEWLECCEECYSQIVTYLYKNWFKPPLIILYYDICGNLMNFGTISSLIFKQSDMFIKIFEYVFACDRLQTLSNIDKTNPPFCYQFGISILFQTILNISLLKTIHWKILGCYFENFLKAITKELECGIYSTLESAALYIHSLLIFIVFVLKHTHAKRNKTLMRLYLRKWRHILQNTKDKDQIDMISQFILLNNNNKLCYLYNSLNEIMVEYDNMRWYEMKCFRCRIKRINADLKKCKSCRVTRYCSKQCQKNDWNEHNHRQQCKTFRKMRKQYRKVSKRAKTLPF
eukprot:462969_1